MKSKISYVILKYDAKADAIFTKSSNNSKHAYKMPTFEYDQTINSVYDDVKKAVHENLFKLDTFVDENHIFLPFVNVIPNKQSCNYVAVVFETTKDYFSSMNYESWSQVKYDHIHHAWDLSWDNGLSDPADYMLEDAISSEYVANPKDEDEINFSNVMHFIDEKTREFPILGLMAGDEFTMGEVFHYQDLLGIEALKAGNNATFENQYSDSIQAIKDNRLTTSYKIKKEYL